MVRISFSSTFDDKLSICPDTLHIDSTFAKQPNVRHRLLYLQSLKYVSGRFFTPISEGHVGALLATLARQNSESIMSVKGFPARNVTAFLENMPDRLRKSSLNIIIDAHVNYNGCRYVTLHELVFSAEVTDGGTPEGAITVYHKTRVPASLRMAFLDSTVVASRVTDLTFVVYCKPDDEALFIAYDTLIGIQDLLPNIKTMNVELRYEGEFSLYSQYDTAALASNIACDLRQIQECITRLELYDKNRLVPGKISLNCGIELDGHSDRVAEGLLEYGTALTNAFPTLTSDNLRFTGIIEVVGSIIDVTIAIWTNDWLYEQRPTRSSKRAVDENVVDSPFVQQQSAQWNMTDEEFNNIVQARDNWYQSDFNFDLPAELCRIRHTSAVLSSCKVSPYDTDWNADTDYWPYAIADNLRVRRHSV